MNYLKYFMENMKHYLEPLMSVILRITVIKVTKIELQNIVLKVITMQQIKIRAIIQRLKQKV